MFSVYFLVWPIIATLMMMGVGLLANGRVLIGRSVLVFVLAYGVTWFTLPAFSPDMASTWFTAIVWLAVAAFLGFFDIKEAFPEDQKMLGVIPPIVALILFIGYAFFSSGFFHSASYANILAVEDRGEAPTTVELVSQEQARRVTPSLAGKRAAELIGASQEEGLASRAKFGTMYGNVTPQGDAVWMAPLEPTGFLRWWSNPTTPGYFIGSHVNVNDSRLVEDKPIAYGTGFYLSNDLSRHLYMNGYINYKYGDPFFQIDNDRNPHFVVPLMRPQVGPHAYFPKKWVVVDANSGAIEEFTDPADLPDWVDRAYPMDIMHDRLSDWGCFKNGWVACYFSGENVIEPTPGIITTMDVNDTMIYYTGTQYANRQTDDEGVGTGATSGVSIINARTGMTEWYRRSGITEEVARSVINGEISNQAGWSASRPVLIQVNGRETYFMVVTDAGGARKGYGMVYQSTRDVYGQGKSISETIREYNQSIRTNLTTTAFEGNAEIEAVPFEGQIVSIRPVVSGGNTTFYLRLDTVEDKIFAVTTPNPAEVATSDEGDRVRMLAYNPEPALISVDEFDNLMIDLAESDLQSMQDTETEAVNTQNRNERDRRNLEAQIDGMDPEEIREALGAIEQ